MVHLGDDHSMVGPKSSYQRQPGRFLYNDLTVPYRVSQWMAQGWPPPLRPKRILVSGNLNGESTPICRGSNPGQQQSSTESANSHAFGLHVGPESKFRGKLLKSLTLAAKRLNLTHALNLSITNQPPAVASAVALESTFCLSPTGDSKGFTARFYYALLHGCIPVRLDAYPRRNLTLERVALPFPSQLNWSKLMVNVRNAESILRDTPGFLRQLRDMPKEEVQDRITYIRSVRHLFSYDAPATERGAPAALVTELESRLSSINNRAWVREVEKRQQAQEMLSASFFCERLNQAGPRPCPAPIHTVNPGCETELGKARAVVLARAGGRAAPRQGGHFKHAMYNSEG